MENAMKKTQNSKLSYREMQELLPDYAFGRISDSDKINFETTLPDFPDLQQELKDVKAVFSRVEEMDFDAAINRKTRNLSVKVNNRLAAKSKKKTSVRRLAPALLVIIASILVFNIWGTNEKVVTTAIDNSEQPMDNLISTEAETLILSSLQKDEIAHTSELNSVSSTSINTEQMIVDEDEINDLFSDMIAELDGFDDLNGSFTESGLFYDVDYIDEISILDKSEIEGLIEDIQNAKIL
jgi:hypothetical protein